MKYIITFFLSVLGLNAVSQNQSDSLFSKLKTSTDEEKVDIYLAIAKQNWRLSTDSIYKYSRIALDLSRDISYTNGEAKALSYIGVTFFYKAEYDSVLYYYDAAIEKFKQSNDMEHAAITINNKGVLFKRMGNFTKAIECYNEAIKIHKKTNNHLEIGGAFINIGVVYEARNDLDKAMEYNFLALEQFEKINNKEKIAAAYTNIGHIYADLKQELKSLEFYKKALTLQKESNDVYGIANSLSNIGIVCKNSGSYPKSEKYFKESLELYKNMQDQDAIAWVYNHLGNVYALMKQWPKALNMYEKTIEIEEKIGDTEGLAYVKSDLAEIYFAKKDWLAAQKNLKEGIKLGSSIELYDLLEKSYLLLSRVDSAQGNFAKSLEDYKRYSQFKDTIFNQESSRNITEMQTKYETSKKEQQIELLEQEKSYQELRLKKNRIIGIISVVGILILFSLIFGWYRYQQHKRAEEALLKNTMETEDKERKRIAEELHDGIGPLLSTVKMYINEIEGVNGDSPEKELILQSDKIIDEAICSARNLSHNLMPQNIEKDGLIKSLQVFTNRICINNNPEIDLEPINMDGFGLWQQVMVYRIITELINNTIKHSGAGKISIRFQKLNKNLNINYSDNGKGFDVEKVLENEQGIGLKNIVSRVGSLKGTVDFKSSSDNGFNAIINIGIKHLLN